MTTDTPAAATARRGRRGAILAILLLVVLAIVLAGVFPFRQSLAQDRLVDNTRAKLDALVAENRNLRDQIDAAQTPLELERFAREQYGMARPGETIYVVEPDDSVSPEPPVDPDAEVDSRSPLERLWDFLTGRDLVPDG